MRSVSNFQQIAKHRPLTIHIYHELIVRGPCRWIKASKCLQSTAEFPYNGGVWKKEFITANHNPFPTRSCRMTRHYNIECWKEWRDIKIFVLTFPSSKTMVGLTGRSWHDNIALTSQYLVNASHEFSSWWLYTAQHSQQVPLRLPRNNWLQ